MRPELNRTLPPEQFMNYYWLKEELTDFCRSHSLPGTGSKRELTERICSYLKTGKIPETKKVPARKRTGQPTPPCLDGKIPEGYKNDEIHRAFFRDVIGDHFRFNVPFMNWMKKNAGCSYRDAVNEWQRIDKDKKGGKKYEISSQFEYNRYTRDFFTANPELTRADVLTCWKYKKSRPGPNRYEEADLQVLRPQQIS